MEDYLKHDFFRNWVSFYELLLSLDFHDNLSFLQRVSVLSLNCEIIEL